MNKEMDENEESRVGNNVRVELEWFDVQEREEKGQKRWKIMKRFSIMTHCIYFFFLVLLTSKGKRKKRSW